MKHTYIDVPMRVRLQSGKKTDTFPRCRLLHDIAPHLAHIATFALLQDGRWYRIVHVETGRLVSPWYRSVGQALGYRSVLERVTEEMMLKAMRAMKEDRYD